MFFVFCLFRATPAAYGGSQARSQIRASPSSYSHSHARSKLHLQPTCSLWQCQILNPQSEARDQACTLMDTLSTPPAPPLTPFSHSSLLGPPCCFVKMLGAHLPQDLCVGQKAPSQKSSLFFFFSTFAGHLILNIAHAFPSLPSFPL